MSILTKFNKDDTFQRLRANHFDPDKYPITQKESEILERIKRLFLYRSKNKYSKLQAVQKVAEEFKVHQSTVYRDYKMMTEIYGEVDEVDVRAEKMFTRNEYYFLYQQMLKERDWQGALKALEKYDATFPEIDPNEADPEKLAAQTFHIQMSREMSKKLDALITKKTEKTNGKKSKDQFNPIIDFRDMDVEDVDYKIVRDNEGDI